MKKQYVLMHILVDGPVKGGDRFMRLDSQRVYETKSGLMTSTVGRYNRDIKLGIGSKVILYLCDRDIQIGDDVIYEGAYSEHFPFTIENEDDLTFAKRWNAVRLVAPIHQSSLTFAQAGAEYTQNQIMVLENPQALKINLYLRNMLWPHKVKHIVLNGNHSQVLLMEPNRNPINHNKEQLQC